MSAPADYRRAADLVDALPDLIRARMDAQGVRPAAVAAATGLTAEQVRRVRRGYRPHGFHAAALLRWLANNAEE